MKRFWDTASVAASGSGFTVLLDGKPLKIPGRAGGAALALPGRALAAAVAAEWQAAGGAKGGAMTMDAVPLTRLAGTAQDRVAPNPGPVARELARYAESDVLCYRAAHPEALVRRQEAVWQPWLDWLDRAYDARLAPVTGVVHVAQDPAALARVEAAMAGRSAWELAALGIAVPVLGSAVLGLALADGAVDAAGAHAAAALDELFEVEAWGEDAEAAARRAAVLEDLAATARFMALCREGAA